MGTEQYKQWKTLTEIAESARQQLDEAVQYKTLNDAAVLQPILAKGKNTEIWYLKSDNIEARREFGMGYDWLIKKAPLFLPKTPKDLPKTHAQLGVIDTKGESQFEDVFHAMQGGNWSPQGEAKSLIRSSGLSHTSMSVGDIIVYKGKMFLVDNTGFKKI